MRQYFFGLHDKELRRRSVRIKDAIVGEHSTEAGPNEFIPHRAEQLELRLSTK